MNYVFDIEANGLNPDKIHCMVANGKQVHKDFFVNLTEDDVLIGHNIIRYDVPVLEKLLGVKIKAKLIDTLALSWYLFAERNKHGLADWGVEFGIPKPVIEDWDNLSEDEYIHRCSEDVKINTRLWQLQEQYLVALYGNDYSDLVEYLTFKMHCAMLQEQNKWKLDVDKANTLLVELTEKQSKAVKSLEATMPPVQVFKDVTRPQKPFKQDGTLSEVGKRWSKVCAEHGINFNSYAKHKIPNGFKEPKATSPVQIKDWLFSLGWKPQTYKYVEDGYDLQGKQKQRKIPQIKKGDMLCPSVIRMVDKHPELKNLEELGVLGHRVALVSGLIKNCDEDGYVIAAIQGLTNTLRFKHAVCVNIPSPRMPYGSEIRSLLTIREGRELCGSDMSSLEDRTKQHYMMPHDSDYVEEMNKEGFDPHLDIAVEAKFLTQEQADAYKAKDFSKFDEATLSAQRHKGKTTNYASTYGAGAQTIARGAEATLEEGEALHKAYWDRNWSLKAIADDQTTKNVNGKLWLHNPVSGLYYELRSKKDIFSTLNQGTGTYCFDMWVMEILKRTKTLLAQFHDEVILDVPCAYREGITKLLKECVKEVNKKLNLNRELDVDVDFGKTYAEIH